MTLDNLNYRTSPFFLRNTLYGVGKYDMPVSPRFEAQLGDFDNLRLLGYDKVNADDGKHADRIVHFFLYDYKFEKVWNDPTQSIDRLRKYKAVLTPDFSLYIQMHRMQQMFNVFRNRWCGAYFASRGLRVIPTVNWGLEPTFEFCFEGIPKGSAVAVSTYMVQEHNGKPAQKDFFMKGYNEMLRRLEPEVIICYHTPFSEMSGNIIHVDYDLSSWRYMNA